MVETEGIRLQKVLSQAGIASRRAAEKLIIDGRVEVDGQVVTELGTRVDPDASVIRVDGARVVLDDSLVYLALNKPRGMHSTMSDDRGRPCIGDLVEHRVRGNKNLFHVGRLDADTEGLILLTNDGELAHRLMHPSHEVPKTYLATVTGTVPRGLGKRLRAGIELDDGPARVDDFAVVDAIPGKTLVRVMLHEGRNRIVRRLLAAAGFPVEALVRTDIGRGVAGRAAAGQHPGFEPWGDRATVQGGRTVSDVVVAIDGPAGTGKSSVSKGLAQRTGCALPGHRGHVPDGDAGGAARGRRPGGRRSGRADRGRRCRCRWTTTPTEIAISLPERMSRPRSAVTRSPVRSRRCRRSPPCAPDSSGCSAAWPRGPAASSSRVATSEPSSCPTLP